MPRAPSISLAQGKQAQNDADCINASPSAESFVENGKPDQNLETKNKKSQQRPHSKLPNNRLLVFGPFLPVTKQETRVVNAPRSEPSSAIRASPLEEVSSDRQDPEEGSLAEYLIRWPQEGHHGEA